MTAVKTKDDLVVAAARLSKAAPNTWKEFVEALAAFTQLKVSGCVAAKPKDVILAQGRARECLDLLGLFTVDIKSK